MSKASLSVYWPLLGLFVLASFGCQPTSSEPAAALQQVDTQLITQRGRIRFIADTKTGRQLARQQGLPCLLFFTAEWCTFCHQMEASAFAAAEIEALAENFVCVLVDADREADVCRQFDIRGYPTVQFLAADGRRLHRLVGRQPTSKLVAGMQAAIQRLTWLEKSETQHR